MSSNFIPLALQKFFGHTMDDEREIPRENESGPSDNELIFRIQRGDQEAFSLLFDRYHTTVRAVVRGVVRMPDEVEDVVQEAFLDVYLNCGTFDASRGTVRTWISVIARYRSIRRWRKARNQQWQAGDAEGADSVVDPRSSPEDRVRSIDFRNCLDVVLETLTEKQQQTMILYFFEGLDLGAIASHLGESFANTRHYLYRGLVRLRREVINRRLMAGYTEYGTCSDRD